MSNLVIFILVLAVITLCLLGMNPQLWGSEEEGFSYWYPYHYGWRRRGYPRRYSRRYYRRPYGWYRPSQWWW